MMGALRANTNVVIANDGDVAVFVPFSFKALSPYYRRAWTERRSSMMDRSEFLNLHAINAADGAVLQLLEALKISEAEFREALRSAFTDRAERQRLWKIVLTNRSRRSRGDHQDPAGEP
jgi:hypothetical protein